MNIFIVMEEIYFCCLGLEFLQRGVCLTGYTHHSGRIVGFQLNADDRERCNLQQT